MRSWAGPWLAALLIMQWAGSVGACLASMAWDPARVICHGGTAPAETPDPVPVAGCPLCAPLPPGLLPPLPAPPSPRPAPVLSGAALPALVEAPSVATVRPQQPRAPPEA